MAPETSSTAIFVMMGVSGSGKSTIGSLLGQRLGATFADADDYHPAANKAKMAAGHPLTDEDREPWLRALNRVLLSWNAHGCGGVLACSALREHYRSILSEGLPSGTIKWVLLSPPREVISARLQARHHEFMNPGLLASQFATLEVPPVTDALCIRNDREPAEVVEQILEASGQSPSKEQHGTSSV